jgi:hypothetical protein
MRYTIQDGHKHLKSVVYCLTVCGEEYYGKTAGELRIRAAQHASDLKYGIHPSPIMQRYWDEGYNLHFRAVYQGPDLIEMEQKFINKRLDLLNEYPIYPLRRSGRQ